jgi:penicillin-binding protein 1C
MNAELGGGDGERGRVVAAAGNFDFRDADHQGQVVGFLAPRSPGSSLKPFLYALALDRGQALPSYLVADAPVNYQGYEPVNFDREFRGLVRWEDALSQSLNIPFIDLLSRLGVEEYLRFLAATVDTPAPAPPPPEWGSVGVGGI